MAKIFEQLATILIRAVPTFFLVLFLYWFLRKFFFEPLDATLEQRRRATEGAMDKAEAVVARAAARSASYEQAIAEARAQIYHENEALREKLAAEQARLVEAARQRSAQTVAASIQELNTQLTVTRGSLETESERLAEDITRAVLAGRAA